MKFHPHLFICFFLLCCSQSLLAKPESIVVRSSQAPVQLSMQLSADTAFPGTPITLDLTVLVSTWMSKAPIYPDLEINNIMLRLPTNASHSVGEPVDGERWVGTTRSYLIYPMLPGRYTLPSKPITITYADPDTRQPKSTVLKTPEIRFRSVMPKTSIPLEPFIGARNLTLEQTISGPVNSLDELSKHTFKVGDAITRTIIVDVEGTSPIFLPPILTSPPLQGLASYPKEPELVEQFDLIDGISGTRSEEVTYTFEQGGRYRLPAIQLRWYNLDNGVIETTELDAITLVARLTLLQRLQRHWRLLLAIGIGLSLLVVIARWLLPSLWQRLERIWKQARHYYLASEHYAFRQASQAVNNQELDRCLKDIPLWRAKIAPEAPETSQQLTLALTTIGTEHYGQSTAGPSADSWKQLGNALKQARRAYISRRQRSRSQQLPPLNPDQTH